MKIDIGNMFEVVINWLTDHGAGVFDLIAVVIEAVVAGVKAALLFPHPWLAIVVFTAIAYRVAKIRVAAFSLVGLGLVHYMGLWTATMESLALVLTAVLMALVVGVPLGIWASKNEWVEQAVRPILDFMQTLPAFVYLIPAVLFFRLGEVPGVIATLIFALPPAVRLTSLGIRQVPVEIREAAISFGSTGFQMLTKVELPVAMPTIMAGINQTIMLALSMVVIAGMIGAGGLGNEVLKGITQLRIDLGFEAGISIVVLAIYLDRVTQAFASEAAK